MCLVCYYIEFVASTPGLQKQLGPEKAHELRPREEAAAAEQDLRSLRARFHNSDDPPFARAHAHRRAAAAMLALPRHLCPSGRPLHPHETPPRHRLAGREKSKTTTRQRLEDLTGQFV
ncbi:unnamed protein product, partial [Iphiclides podalirius]